jgi:hypothetical protein
MQLGSRPQGGGTSAAYGNNAPSSPSAPAAAPRQESPAEQIPTINLDEEEEEIKIEDVPF